MNLEINLFILNFLKFIKKYYVYRMNNNIVKMRKKKIIIINLILYFQNLFLICLVN